MRCRQRRQPRHALHRSGTINDRAGDRTQRDANLSDRLGRSQHPLNRRDVSLSRPDKPFQLGLCHQLVTTMEVMLDRPDRHSRTISDIRKAQTSLATLSDQLHC